MKRQSEIEKLEKLKMELRKKLIEVILDEYRFRRYKDLSYSIRRFASDIGMNHIHLNQVLLNQRGLSRKKAEHISGQFNLDYKGRRRFYLLVSASCARSVIARNLAAMGLKNMSIRY